MSFAFQPLSHDEAARRIAALPVVTREVMRGLLPELRAHAFTVAGLQGAEQMARVKRMLAKVPAGANWDDAKKQVAKELKEGGFSDKAAARRSELLLRTTAFRAYAATRYKTLMAQRDVFPFWQYKTAGDGKVRPAHRALNQQIFPAGHDIWQRIFPPWGWGCRCLVVPLTRRAAERAQSEVGGEKGDGGNLLPTQKAAPRLYTPAEADVIAKAGRLPDGISLEVEPTWGHSPWSEKGNLRPSWDHLEQLYKDPEDAEAFEAFRKWAGETEIEQGVTVADWIGGAESAPRTSRAAPLRPGRAAENRVIKASVPARKSPVSAVARNTARGDSRDVADKAAILIDHAHDDGSLPPVTIDNHVAADEDGRYVRRPRPHGSTIGLREGGGFPLNTALHEWGHHIRHELDPKLVARVLEAAEAGGTMRLARDIVLKPEFFTESEVFSRAYAQYVAEAVRGVDTEAWDEVQDMLGSIDGLYAFDAKEWPSIRDAVKVALKERKWL
ncbi:MAG: minor capsid protein [Verrucomicrobiaceae bacterium]|nr:minor capsid protein [Verrucomicrobiaceae bacterium]